MSRPAFLRRFLGLFGITPEFADDDFREAYGRLLLNQYRTLPRPVNATTPAQPEAETWSEGDRLASLLAAPAGVEWDELYALELALIKLEPPERLVRRAWTLRSEYEEIASPTEWADYQTSGPPKASAAGAAEIAALRADLIRLQEELNWRYMSLWTLEAFRGLLLAGVVWGAALVLAGGALLAWFANARLGLNGLLLFAIAGAGVLGGLASALRRVTQATLSGNTDLEMAGLNNGNLGVYISPALGGMFALLLTCLFASGLLSGSGFPQLDGTLLCGQMTCAAWADGELAKLLVWAFISGFCERFVPDRLAKLAADASQPDMKKIARKKTAQG